MELVLGYLGADRRQLQDLVAEWVRILPSEGVVAASATGGLERNEVITR
jgi:hypothetical protein